ncbi:ATP-binding protein [Chitinimonas sp.]|uniref:ATP-binding protein n=1 Tax=Chitinimonas sp. TaxID=1934313 RepID=UPI0035B3A581
MKRIPLRLYPRTLFWRLAGVTVLAMLLSLSFVVALFAHNRLQMIASNVADQSGELLASAEDQLDGMSPAAQKNWIEYGQPPYTAHLRELNTAEAPAPTLAPRTMLSRTIASTIRKKFGNIGDIRETSPPRRQLWVSVEVLGKRYWLVIPLGRYRFDPTGQFAIAAGIFTIASIVLAALVSWRISLPLRKLSMAAARLGRGEHPEPLAESGPYEVQALSASFNRMLADLESSERERNVMLAGISHDLRTPLARLRMGVEMMADPSLQDGMREDVEDIERILGQFIAFARGLGDEAACDCQPEDLARSLLSRYAREGCTIDLVLADDLPIFKARPLALSRALSNLIDNARRYGAAPISLSVQREADAILFEVSDHGPGIAPDKMAEALKPFHRLDSARRADGGSGLGFAIVDRIARLHGGSLSLDNRAQGGLKATLHLPI